MKKSIWLVLALPLFIFSCSKESISDKIIGTWKTDWTDKLSKPLKELNVNEGISFFEEPGKKDQGLFESAFIGTVDYKDKKNETIVEYMITVPGTWTVVDGDDLVLHYDITKIKVNVSHEKQDKNITGMIGDVASDIFAGNWGGAIDNVIGTVTSGDVNSKIDQEASNQLTKYFRELLTKRNKEKVTYQDVEVDDMNMVCDPVGWFSSKITYYKTDNEPVHLINDVTDIQQVEEVQQTKNDLEKIDSTVTETIENLDSTLNNLLENI